MTEAHSKWKTLPVELMRTVFKQATRNELYHLSLVCKAWLIPAQTLLYSKIQIQRFPQLKKIYIAIKNNPRLGYHVKEFELLDCFFWEKKKIAKTILLRFMASLLFHYLPNLEVLQEPSLFPCNILIFDALMDSKLKRLKNLKPPEAKSEKGEAAIYINSALLMKDRLENITISDDYSFNELHYGELFFQRLYNNLKQFNKVSRLYIRKQTAEVIQVMEHIVESCKSLEKLRFDFTAPGKSALLNNLVSFDTISGFIPRPYIKTINGSGDMTIDNKTLLYIIHKFPELKSLSLDIIHSYQKLNRQILDHLLLYVSKIEHVAVFGLEVDSGVITEAIGSLWDKTATLGNEELQFTYSGYTEEEQLDLKKSKGSNRYFTQVYYPASNPRWPHTDFIERNGKFLDSLVLDFSINDLELERRMLPENFMAHTLTHCPNLKYLRLGQSTLLRPTSFTGLDSIEKRSLLDLSFEGCYVETGMMEHLSRLLLKIERLDLTEVSRIAHEDIRRGDGAPIFEINMPHTEICTIHLNYVDNEEDCLYVNVLASSEEKYYYFRYDDCEANDCCVEMSEEEYVSADKDINMYICCKHKPKVTFEWMSY